MLLYVWTQNFFRIIPKDQRGQQEKLRTSKADFYQIPVAEIAGIYPGYLCNKVEGLHENTTLRADWLLHGTAFQSIAALNSAVMLICFSSYDGSYGAASFFCA